MKFTLTPINFLCAILISFAVHCQEKQPPNITLAKTKFIVGADKDLFGTAQRFIENIGQYEYKAKGQKSIGKILYGYEGLRMPVLFSSKGLVFLQRQIKFEEAALHGKEDEEQEESHFIVTDQQIFMHWLNSNPNVKVTSSESAKGYHTYANLPGKASAFKKITYHDLYPGIDLIFAFTSSLQPGFEYSIVIKPGANPSAIRMHFSGNVKRLFKDSLGRLIIHSNIERLAESAPICYYQLGGVVKKEKIGFFLDGDVVSFSIPKFYDHNKPLIIDPFVTPDILPTTNNFPPGFPTNYGKAKDVDFDYAGNVYIAGGGDFISPTKLAKYDPTGNLLWTFTGTITNSDWLFGTNYGGWVVDKITGKTYLGQGLGVPLGFRIIRLDAAGVYDNYMTTPISNFREDWKMVWQYNNGTPRILICGGGTNGPYNFGIISPPSNLVTPYDLTYGNEYQVDMADLAVDTITNQIYCILGIPGNPVIKAGSPYTPASVIWSINSSPQTVTELSNRPYMQDGIGGHSSEHSMNLFSLNSNYLYFWDGKNLKAFQRSNGVVAGSPFVVSTNTPKFTGGIYATDCNTVFIGDRNGTIRVLKFDGTSFNDALAPDINIPGFTTNSIYDIACDPNTNLLYVSGDGFVAALDISSYISATTFTVPVTVNCLNATAIASVSPSPAPNDVLAYSLYNGSTLVTSNTTGSFSGLNPSLTYTIKVTSLLYCSSQTSQPFTVAGPEIILSKTDACPSGSLTIIGNTGTTPYVYSLDGVNFQPDNHFSNLSPGTYTATIKDGMGCINTASININPCLSGTAATQSASCNASNGSIIVSTLNGSPPYQFGLNGGPFQFGPQFNNLQPGNYHISIKDSIGYVITIEVTVSSINNIQAQVITTASNCLGTGSITVSASSNSMPLMYSLNGSTFQDGAVFSNLLNGSYQIMVKDANGCMYTTSVNVPLINDLNVEVGPDMMVCQGESSQINSSSNGSSFVWSPANGVSNIHILNPIFSPTSTTEYFLDASRGNCTVKDSVLITVNPRPIANAGPDLITCHGHNAQLQGSGGILYHWSPSTYLNDPDIANPISSSPTSTIAYNLTVTDANNCLSMNIDTVLLTVTPPINIFAGNDTSVVVNQPLQLFATSSGTNQILSYEWFPGQNLNNPFIQNPVATLNSNMSYIVNVEDQSGCKGSDTISIKVYKGAEIYVPTGFTPNGDGLNDILRPITVGIKEFSYFKIFNRWGEIIFSTLNPQNGWDGRFKGIPVESGGFVWIAKGYDFAGNKIERRGSTVLIR